MAVRVAIVAQVPYWWSAVDDLRVAVLRCRIVHADFSKPAVRRGLVVGCRIPSPHASEEPAGDQE
jgi:hypothetical protein